MQYYVQNVEKGYVGNCVVWGAKDQNGYTCDLRKAEVFEESNKWLILMAENPKYRFWEKTYIDLCSSRMVDMQELVPEYAGLNPSLQKIDFPSVLEIKDGE